MRAWGRVKVKGCYGNNIAFTIRSAVTLLKGRRGLKAKFSYLCICVRFVLRRSCIICTEWNCYSFKFYWILQAFQFYFRFPAFAAVCFCTFIQAPGKSAQSINYIKVTVLHSFCQIWIPRSVLVAELRVDSIPCLHSVVSMFFRSSMA